jgi:hypothetical protein
MRMRIILVPNGYNIGASRPGHCLIFETDLSITRSKFTCQQCCWNYDSRSFGFRVVTYPTTAENIITGLLAPGSAGYVAILFEIC